MLQATQGEPMMTDHNLLASCQPWWLGTLLLNVSLPHNRSASHVS